LWYSCTMRSLSVMIFGLRTWLLRLGLWKAIIYRVPRNFRGSSKLPPQNSSANFVDYHGSSKFNYWSSTSLEELPWWRVPWRKQCRDIAILPIRGCFRYAQNQSYDSSKVKKGWTGHGESGGRYKYPVTQTEFRYLSRDIRVVYAL
jgi:hypothetical protein